MMFDFKTPLTVDIIEPSTTTPSYALGKIKPPFPFLPFPSLPLSTLFHSLLLVTTDIDHFKPESSSQQGSLGWHVASSGSTQVKDAVSKSVPCGHDSSTPIKLSQLRNWRQLQGFGKMPYLDGHGQDAREAVEKMVRTAER